MSPNQLSEPVEGTDIPSISKWMEYNNQIFPEDESMLFLTMHILEILEHNFDKLIQEQPNGGYTLHGFFNVALGDDIKRLIEQEHPEHAGMNYEFYFNPREDKMMFRIFSLKTDGSTDKNAYIDDTTGILNSYYSAFKALHAPSGSEKSGLDQFFMKKGYHFLFIQGDMNTIPTVLIKRINAHSPSLCYTFRKIVGRTIASLK